MFFLGLQYASNFIRNLSTVFVSSVDQGTDTQNNLWRSTAKVKILERHSVIMKQCNIFSPTPNILNNSVFGSSNSACFYSIFVNVSNILQHNSYIFKTGSVLDNDLQTPHPPQKEPMIRSF